MVNSFLPVIGGRELVVKHLASALTRQGHEVRVIGPGGYFKYKNYKLDFPIHRFPSIASLKKWRECMGDNGQLKRPKLAALLEEKLKEWQLYHDLKKWGYDIVHAHNTYPTGYAVAHLKKKLKVPLVITPHGQDIHKIPELGHGLRLNPYLEKRIRFTLEQADAATSISDSIGISLNEAGASKEKIVNIPNGVDLDRFSMSHQVDARQWLSLPKDAKLIVTVGNYHPRKGHEVLVKAMPEVIKKQPQARLVIVGRKSAILQALIQEMGLNECVVLTGSLSIPGCHDGHKDNEESEDYLSALLQSAEMYVSASTDEGAEGLSLALLEGMAAQLPIIATNISGNRDVITTGENGVLVEPKSEHALATAILQLLNDAEEKNKLGKGALEFAKEYSWDNIARQYVDLYRKVIDTADHKA